MVRLGCVLVTLVLCGCSARSNTAQLWENEKEYVLIEERYVSEDSAVALKKKAETTHDIVYDHDGKFYVRQSVARRAGNLVLIVVCTPISLTLDGFNLVARSAIVPETYRDTSKDGRLYKPQYFVAQDAEKERYADAHPPNAFVSGLAITGIISMAGLVR